MTKLPKTLYISIATFLLGVLAVATWLYSLDTQKTQIILPNAQWESIYFKRINEVTSLTGITELREVSLERDNVEIRIWRSTTPFEGVILKRNNNEWSARHLAERYDHTGEIDVEDLNSPQSGWESLWQQVVDKGILTLPDASVIGCGAGGMDAASYIVEINQNKTYRTYRLSADYSEGRCREANQMEEIGDIIGEEFDSRNEQCKRAEWFACTKARKLNKERNQSSPK